VPAGTSDQSSSKDQDNTRENRPTYD